MKIRLHRKTKRSQTSAIPLPRVSGCISFWYGFNTRLLWTDTKILPDAQYKVDESLKILKGSNDLDAWVRYAFGGAYDVPWGTCASGVPKYVLFQDGITVFEKQAGVNYVQIAAYRIYTTLSKGLRKPIY